MVRRRPLIRSGYKAPLALSDLWRLPQGDRVGSLDAQFARCVFSGGCGCVWRAAFSRGAVAACCMSLCLRRALKTPTPAAHAQAL